LRQNSVGRNPLLFEFKHQPFDRKNRPCSQASEAAIAKRGPRRKQNWQFYGYFAFAVAH
jgi:hypothetical protein